jgi:hypothetical protein
MTERWRPLRVRDSSDPAAIEKHDALVDGVPRHLFRSLHRWLETVFLCPGHTYSEEALQALERNLQISLDWDHGYHSASIWFEKHLCGKDPALLLEAVDYVLSTGLEDRAHREEWIRELNQILYEGGSAWKVRKDGLRLERRVPAPVAAAATDAMTKGRAGALLERAWQHTYGRHPEPSTAYKEAVRAAEAAICPVIIPDAKLGTLGKAIPALRDAPPGKFTSIFPAEAVEGRPLDAVLKLMQLLWTSHFDRHGTADESVPLSVSQEQAEAAVHAAVTLVQWFERGFVRMSAPR